MKNFSKNSKLNAVLSDIYEQIETIRDTPEESREEVRRYMREFPGEIDYNIAQYGNILVYYHDVREMYTRAGYKSVTRWSDSKLWEIYKRQTGFVARMVAAEARDVECHTLHRIRAVRDFGNVKAGDLGGWVSDSGRVFGNAEVSDSGRVCGSADVYIVDL